MFILISFTFMERRVNLGISYQEAVGRDDGFVLSFGGLRGREIQCSLLEGKQKGVDLSVRRQRGGAR